MQNERYLLTEYDGDQGGIRWITAFGPDGLPTKTYWFRTNEWSTCVCVDSIQIQLTWPLNTEITKEDIFLELI